MKGSARYRSACLLWLCLAGLAVAAASGTDAPPRESIAFDRAEFVQTRHMAALERPLVSSGTVTVSDAGFVWHQLEPFDVELSFDGDVLIERVLIGGTESVRPLDDPITVNVTKTLFQLMSGSWTDIQKNFETTVVSGERPDNGWHIVLIPRSPDLRSVVLRILLDGDTYLDRIAVEQSNDITTIIELSEQRREQ